MKGHLTRTRGLLAAALVLTCGWATQAAAYTDSAFVSFTLEGCNNDGSVVLPNNSVGDTNFGKYYCPDPNPIGGNDNDYTTGNLGKGWNELDLVPFRLTASLGTQSNATTAYDVIIAADSKTNGIPGFDAVSLVTLDSRSDASCTLSVGAELVNNSGTVTGGVDEVIYRILHITQDKGTTCYVNYVNRIAVGAHDYPGSSLQAYTFEQNDFKTGKKTISLPVKEIKPQELRKDMAATQDSDFAWNVTKEPTPAKVTFSNTCDAQASREAAVKVRVEWSILPGAPGEVMVVTNIYAKNPAARPIDVKITDTIYGDVDGSGPGTVQIIDSSSSGFVTVAANTESLVWTHTAKAPAETTMLSDTATAEYKDNVTGVPVPGQTQANASATIQPGTQTNTSATITDVESISGAGLKFSVDSFKLGSATGKFDPAYALTTATTGPVTWISDPQAGNTSCSDAQGCPVGFVEFNKKIYVTANTQTSGDLSDTATLNASDGYTTASGPASIAVEANALVKLKITKTIPDILQGDETITISFLVENSKNETIATPTMTFTEGQTTQSLTISDLPPDTYVIKETDGDGLVPKGDATQSEVIGLDDCFGEVKFDNIVGAGSAIARVAKVTLPAGNEAGWTFGLKKSGTEVSSATTAGTDFETFLDSNTGTDLQLEEGNYAVYEILKAGWKKTADTGCVFSVNYPADFGKKFDCVFTNTKLGKVIINKLTVPSGDTTTQFRFTEDVTTAGEFYLKDQGKKTFLDVVPGAYIVSEDDPTPGYDLTGLVCTDSDAAGTASTGDKTLRKATINVDPGETVECTFTNTRRGKVELVKLTNGVEDPDMTWNFTLKGTGVNVGDSTPPTLVDFGGAMLVPDETYSICETGIPAGWTQLWYVDANGNGAIDVGEMPLPLASPFGPGNVNKVLLTVYDPDPNYGTINAINDSRCVDFKVAAGATLKLILDNSRPGGEPRTIGYWKNWSSCTGGGQAAKAAANGGFQAGWWLIDNVLPQFLGTLPIDTCQKAVAILSKSTIGAKPKNMASDAAYGLAAQLLAAKANLYAGAEVCSAVDSAVASANSLLATIGFNGTSSFLPSTVKGATLVTRSQALSLANTLDRYNNGNLCQ